MDTSSFIMIGNKNSGKTTSMVSAYGRLSGSGVRGFKIRASDPVEKSEIDFMYDSLKQGRYPFPTQKRSTYFFDLLYNGSMVHQFVWTDFNGGIIDERPNEATEKLKVDMRYSSGLMLFFDAENLYYNRIDAKVRRILHLISQNMRSIARRYFIAVVITKFDLLSDVQKREEEKVFAPLMPFLNVAEQNDCIQLVVVPVSCTKRAMVNVELPLLMLLQGVMDVYCDSKYKMLKAEGEQLNCYIKKSGLLNDVKNLFGMEPDYRKLAIAKYDELLPQIELFSKVCDALDSLGSYLRGINLMDGFRNDKIDKKYKFSDYE